MTDVATLVAGSARKGRHLFEGYFCALSVLLYPESVGEWSKRSCICRPRLETRARSRREYGVNCLRRLDQGSRTRRREGPGESTREAVTVIVSAVNVLDVEVP